MTYLLNFTIDGLPKMPNALLGAPWKVRAGQATTWQRRVWRSCWHLKPPQPLTCASLTLTRASSVEPDHDGLVGSFKAIVDGLVAAGILASDKVSVTGQPTYLWEKCPPTKGHVKVKVEAAL